MGAVKIPLFHYIPHYSLDFVQSKKFITAHTHRGLSFSLGSMEGSAVEYIMYKTDGKAKYEEYPRKFFECYKNEKVAVLDFEEIKRKYPVYPAFYSHKEPIGYTESLHGKYKIGHYCLLPEMEVYIPQGYIIPIDKLYSYEEAFDVLTKSPFFNLDRRITKFFYSIIRVIQWTEVRTYRYPDIDELTPEEKETVRKLCREWNILAEKLTGISMPLHLRLS